jgi:hypothetical protein
MGINLQTFPQSRSTNDVQPKFFNKWSHIALVADIIQHRRKADALSERSQLHASSLRAY